MSPIALFYHCRLSGGDPPIDFDHASAIMAEQMAALKESGLEEAASHICVGVNGGDADFAAACGMAPKKAFAICHPASCVSELSTLQHLQAWIGTHQDWLVCYHHSKCATRKDDFCQQWRHRMQEDTISKWRRCVADLNAGAQVAGSYWLTPEQFPGLVGSPYAGGNFWWSKASYLVTLPPLPEPTWANRYHAESWVGLGPRRPVVKAYRSGWPMS